MENQLLKVKDLRIAFNTEGRINEVIKGIDLNINRGDHRISR